MKDGICHCGKAPQGRGRPSTGQGSPYLWVVPRSVLCLDSHILQGLKIFRIVQGRFDVEPGASFCPDLHRFLCTEIQTVSDTGTTHIQPAQGLALGGDHRTQTQVLVCPRAMASVL